MRRGYPRFLLLLLLCLPACGEAGDTPEPDETTTTTVTDPGGLPDDLRATIISEAAGQAGVTEDEVEVVSVEATMFEDTSLGCPEEGQMYAQVLTPGFVVLVRAGGTELDYRVNAQAESFFLCENS